MEKIPCDIENTTGVCPVDSMQILSVNNVTFFYPDGTPRLSGVDLTIQRGSKVAIVGSNGSGKSTLIKLLLRFYDAASGKILQNGTDIRNFDISSYRSQFAAAFQDFNIYAASIRNNICMGDEDDFTEDRLKDALDKAGFFFREDCCNVWRWSGFFIRTAILSLWMSRPPQWMCSLKENFMTLYLKS